MSKKTLTLFSLFLFFSFYSSLLVVSGLGQRRGGEIQGNPPELRIELELFKKQYLLREPIWARFKVTNIGDEAGKFYFSNVDALVIADSAGVVYPCSIAIERVAITISPGQTLEKASNLLLYYGIGEDKFRIHRYLPPGRYTIYYELNQWVGSDAYKVYAKSQIDTFHVLQPKGTELKAMSLLKKSYDLSIEKKYNECLKKLNQIIEEHPQSNYAPYALFQKVSMYKIGAIPDLDKTIGSYYQMLNTYPNSREAVQVLSYLLHYYKTKPDIPGLINYLNGLLKRHPNTRVAEEAQKELAKIKE